MASVQADDTQFTGNVTFVKTVVFPVQTIGDAQINPAAAISSPKLEHRFMPKLAQVFGVAATAERRVVHRAKSVGTIAFYYVGLSVANVGAATVTVDLLKNGTSVLSAPVVLSSATVVYTGAVLAAVATAAYTVGDVFEVNITVAAGGGTLGQGVFAAPIFTEAA